MLTFFDKHPESYHKYENWHEKFLSGIYQKVGHKIGDEQLLTFMKSSPKNEVERNLKTKNNCGISLEVTKKGVGRIPEADSNYIDIDSFRKK